MAGRRKNFDGQYVMIDMPFLRGDEYRVVDFSNIELLAYLRLWGRAVEYRRTILPPKFNAENPGVISSLIGVHRQVVEKTLRKCRENELIEVLPDGRLRIVGVEVVHANLPFKDVPITPYIKPDIGVPIGKEKEKESNIKDPAPQKPARTVQPKKDFNLIRDALKKGSGEEPSSALVNKILYGAKGKLDPVHLVEYVYDPKHGVKNPIAYITSALKNPGSYMESIKPWRSFLDRLTGPEEFGDIFKRMAGQT